MYCTETLSSNYVIKFWIPSEDGTVETVIEVDGYRKKIYSCSAQRVKGCQNFQVCCFGVWVTCLEILHFY